MNIKSIELFVIKMPLKQPFITHLGEVSEREGIIIKALDKDGIAGYGEGVAFSSPWYTEETVATSLHMLSDFLIPLLQKRPISHPEQASKLFHSVRRNNMAKAAIETALWDLYAKQHAEPLARTIGGTAKMIPSGVVVAAQSMTKAQEQIEQYLADGYKRIKVKINPDMDYPFLSEIRRRYPNLPIMADANSAYTLKDVDRLKALDELDLLMIEQPLAHDDLIEHAILQKQIKTPVCLDESIVSFEDARKAIEYGSCKIINIKIGRVGGINEAKRIHDYCLERGIPVWCGGMIEFGISRAHNIALASMPGFTIPGDISASNRFWNEDIISPEVTVENGLIAVPQSPGIGYELNDKRLEQTLVHKKFYTF
ncbi:o-succinylbenzoate synthase [Neobacillus dielmonensis]|uniref:o-succinylbenzoate synthase n=1 Tax=Neobacillus dielmonensis TaxID=1347369 RepID=UPI0005A73D49|nr:o-succinylbenzoate synthase [Neobacillus dielmonensis]